MTRLTCLHCTAPSNGALPGSGWIELVLWLAWVLPGLVYTLWRRTGTRRVCPACGGPAVPQATAADPQHGQHLAPRVAPSPTQRAPLHVEVVRGLSVVGFILVATVALVVLLGGR